MNNGTEPREQAEQLGFVIDRLVDMVRTIKEAFSHQQKQPLDDLGKRKRNIVEETAFAAAKADEQMIGLPLKSRKPLFRYQSILMHLRMVGEAVHGVAEALQQQIHDRVPFSDRAIEESNLLLERQESILNALGKSIRTGDGALLKEAGAACRELGRSCLRFASRHESRLANGFFLPKAAPIFLAIIDKVQNIVHHEKETIRLLARREKYPR